jgi:probable HAF family extracellular repeat protein
MKIMPIFSFQVQNETTDVSIDSQSNIKFSDFVGASLEIETAGSIDGGDVFLNDEDSVEEPGLVLKSGLEGEQRPVITGYDYTKLELPGAIDSYVYDINDTGEVVGYSTLPNDGSARSFVYRDGAVQDLNIFFTRWRNNFIG